MDRTPRRTQDGFRTHRHATRTRTHQVATEQGTPTTSTGSLDTSHAEENPQGTTGQTERKNSCRGRNGVSLFLAAKFDQEEHTCRRQCWSIRRESRTCSK
jgi:hypothetical protein